MSKSKRARAVDIPQKVKRAVWERDGERCILCGDHMAMPNAHVIPRSAGGMGVEKNVVTLCESCHYTYDHTTARKALRDKIEEYLRAIYPDWNEAELIYQKWGQFK